MLKSTPLFHLEIGNISLVERTKRNRNWYADREELVLSSCLLYTSQERGKCAIVAAFTVLRVAKTKICNIAETFGTDPIVDSRLRAVQSNNISEVQPRRVPGGVGEPLPSHTHGR